MKDKIKKAMKARNQYLSISNLSKTKITNEILKEKILLLNFKLLKKCRRIVKNQRNQNNRKRVINQYKRSLEILMLYKTLNKVLFQKIKMMKALVYL